MIIWINGAFGSGKTQTAYELQRRLPCSYVYDPENIGFFIRENVPPSIRASDFQDYHMWRAFNLEMLSYIARRYEGDVIVPMTVTNRAYYDEIIGALSEEHEVRHFILWAEKETLLKRLASRLESRRSWAARQIDRCTSAFCADITEFKIYTDGMSIPQVAEAVAGASGVVLSKDGRSSLRRAADRLVPKFRHIR